MPAVSGWCIPREDDPKLVARTGAVTPAVEAPLLGPLCLLILPESLSPQQEFIVSNTEVP